MNIGRLDRKIVIESGVDAQNEYGEYVTTWSTYHTCFASVSRFGGVEKLNSGKIEAKNRVRFKIRFFDGIYENMRVIYDSKTYNITEIQELGREGLWLTCHAEF